MNAAVEPTGFLDREQSFHEQAIRKVGLDDFGDASYRDGLRALLEAYDGEAKFSSTGRFVADFQIVDILKKSGFRGYATLEYEAAEPALTAVPRELERLRALL